MKTLNAADNDKPFLRHISKFFLIDNINKLIKPFVTVFVIYCFSQISIWRANFSYIDDLGRAFNGKAWSHEFHRYVSSWLAYFFTTNFKLADISPLYQIIAMGFAALASIIIAYVFCDKKIKTFPLIMSVFVGLNPFVLGCWVYKFDALPMAFSMFVSVIAFVFWSDCQLLFGGGGGDTVAFF
jgi:hypothetical protein